MGKITTWVLLVLVIGLGITSGGLSQEHQQLVKTKKRSSAVVVGTVYCDTCFKDVFSKSSSHFISDASVAVECIDGKSKTNFRQEVKTDEHGGFRVKLPFSVSKHVKSIKRCSVKLLSSSEPYCSVASSASSSSLKRLKSGNQETRVFSAGFFTFKPENQPEICSQRPIGLQDSKTELPDSSFPPPVQDPSIPDPSPLPFLPSLPPLPSLPGLPPLPPLTQKSTSLTGRKSSSLSSKKQSGSLQDKKAAVRPNFIFPPNPLNPPSLIPPNPFIPPPSIIPPNPLLPPPSVLPPNPFQPPRAPLIPPLQPIPTLPPVPGVTPPSPPPPALPFPFPPITIPPSPIFPGIPPASPSSSGHRRP